MATVTGSGTTYNVAVSGMTGSGTVIASLAAGVVHDGVGRVHRLDQQRQHGHLRHNAADDSGDKRPVTRANNATGVSVTTNLVITFSENIQKGTSGNVVIKNSSDNSVVETIAVTSSQVTVSGAKATIVLTNPLDPNASYYVQVDAGAFTDLAGNPFAGISESTTWNFTTGESIRHLRLRLLRQ